MITFTKEQLIASAHARIEFAEMMLAGELEPLKERTWSIELELARIALASLEAKSRKLFTCSGCGAEGLDEPLESKCHCNEDDAHWVEGVVYTAPPASVSDSLLSELLAIAKKAADAAEECAHAEFSDDSMEHSAPIADWERRAAMLQGAEPVTTAYKLPANTPCKDAPEHIWLQTAGVWPENGEFSELTWCSDNQHQDDTLYVRADVVTGNSSVIAKAYDIEAFGVFSATEGENGLMLQIERFRFGSEKCPQIVKENMVPKFALQAIIKRLQAHCDSMGNEALVDILSMPAAPQQEV